MSTQGEPAGRRVPDAGRAAVARCVTLLVLVLALAACENGALPRGREIVESPWSSFDEAKAAYDQIDPGNTTIGELKTLGYDPHSTPNITILSYLDIIQRFMPNDSIKLDDLEPGVRACISARSACYGYHVHPQQLHGQRVGNVLADVFNFRRHTIRTGWTFSAIVLLKDDRVLYKIWSGEPNIASREDKHNPLGPLQSADDLARAVVAP